MLFRSIDAIIDVLKQHYPSMKNYRWHALKLLEQDPDIMKRYPIDLPEVMDRSYEKDIINQKYDFIEEIIGEVLMNKEKKEQLTDKMDQLLTHPVLGVPVFLGIMALVFALTFNIGDWLKETFVEAAIDWCSTGILNCLTFFQVNEVLVSLIVDGIVAGVGTILTFLPNIFIQIGRAHV